MTIVLVSHDLGFVTNLVQRVICVNRQAVAHPTSQLTAELIRDMYGGDVNMVRHGDVMCHREHVQRGSRERGATQRVSGSTSMSDFFNALTSPDVPVIRYALAAGLLSSVALGIIGTYVITRRISYIAGAISHSVLGGIGAALYLQVVWHCGWCDPTFGAVAAALASALVIGA